MTEPRWTRETIKAELKARFGPLAHISLKWGYDPGAISKTLSIRGYSPTIEELIAEALGSQPHELWPDRWTPEGDTIPPRPRPNISALPANPHRQKRAAA